MKDYLYMDGDIRIYLDYFPEKERWHGKKEGFHLKTAVLTVECSIEFFEKYFEL
jgi:hypothetical protein